MKNYKERLQQIPNKPGVYLMKDKAGTIIYIGKAKDLKKRVSQYFRDKNKTVKVTHMMKNVEDFEYIIVDSEIESLILEQTLIKKNKPKYNISLKDDKQYPFIKVSINEKWPRVYKTRNILKDGAKYFGPYPNAFAVNDAIDLINEIYPIRKCNLKIGDEFKGIKPCLYYHIKKCIGPCSVNADREKYMEYINDIIKLLKNGKSDIHQKVQNLMETASKNLEFEKAALYRDKMNAIEYLTEKQLVVHSRDDDRDFIALAKAIDSACIQIFFVRQGKLVGREHFTIKYDFEESAESILSTFIKQFYMGTAHVPKEIIVESEPEDIDLLKSFLKFKRGSGVSVTVPERGEKKDMLSVVKKNARDMVNKYSDDMLRKKLSASQKVKLLKKLIGLEKDPKRIECYDISHISGAEAVGSMVVFEDGTAKKSDYRRFRIREFNQNDDCKSMGEVIRRRLVRLLDSQKDESLKSSFNSNPDLILIDGGKGQVSAVEKVLDEMGLCICVCGLVKDEFHNTRGILVDGKEINLEPDDDVYRLLYQIQEEAHRFAITYHKSLRGNAVFKSELDDVPGIGSVRKMRLMQHFKDINKIKSAGIDELLEVEGMNLKAAESVYKYFRR